MGLPLTGSLAMRGYALTYSQTMSPSRVTWNSRPLWPSSMKVLPFGSRLAALMCVLRNAHDG